MGTGRNIDWLWVVIAAGIALYLWEHWRSRKAKTAAAPTSTPLGMNLASDPDLLIR